jgi:hypothetical protein
MGLMREEISWSEPSDKRSRNKSTRQRDNWKARAERCREALEFYADPANWRSAAEGFALQYDREPSPIEKDRGRRARRLVGGNQ